MVLKNNKSVIKEIYKKIIIKPYYKFEEYIRIIARITMSKRKWNEIEIIEEEISQETKLNDKRIKGKFKHMIYLKKEILKYTKLQHG